MKDISLMTLDELVTEFRRVKGVLDFRKAALFCSGVVVWVEFERYTGFGIVVLEDHTPPDALSVRLENGNVWHYPVHKCSPKEDRREWPGWIKRQKRSDAALMGHRLRRQQVAA